MAAGSAMSDRLDLDAFARGRPRPRYPAGQVGDVGIGRGGGAASRPIVKPPPSMSSVVRAILRPSPRALDADVAYWESRRRGSR
jgi:hypothetical protein